MKRKLRTVPRYLVLHKPYGVLSKFTDLENRSTLADYVKVPHVYPVGRLDMDSEGLLVLTSDGNLAAQLTSPAFKIPKIYWVQIERVPKEATLKKLRNGLLIKGRRTRPAHVELLSEEPVVYPRPVPIRVRRSVPTAWLRMEISEGMNRQLRRMTAQVGHPALRVIRVAIGPLQLGRLAPGEWRMLSRQEIQDLRGFKDGFKQC